MQDYISIGPVPANEDCEQLGPNYNAATARRQCKKFIDLIRQELGREPEGARLAIKSNQHDFGVYLDVVCHYDVENQKAVDYAFKCDSEAPQDW